MVKRETMLKWNLKKAKKELWSIFSKFIRLRDDGVCFTCGKKIPDYYDRHGNLIPGWKAGQAGHWITAANCGLALYFHEMNVHCQCYHCNVNLSGNWLEYECKIIERYGEETARKLKEMKWKYDIKYSVADYVEMIQKYTNEFEALQNKH